MLLLYLSDIKWWFTLKCLYVIDMPFLDKAFLKELEALDTEDCDPTIFYHESPRQTDR